VHVNCEGVSTIDRRLSLLYTEWVQKSQLSEPIHYLQCWRACSTAYEYSKVAVISSWHAALMETTVHGSDFRTCQHSEAALYSTMLKSMINMLHGWIVCVSDVWKPCKQWALLGHFVSWLTNLDIVDTHLINTTSRAQTSNSIW